MKNFDLMSSTDWVPLGAWVSLLVSLFSGTVHKGTVRNSPPHIAFPPLQRWSENQNPKYNAHTCKYFINAPHPSLFSSFLLSLWLSLCWSLSFPFLPVSCDAVFDTHKFFLWSTSLEALYSLLCKQLVSATASLLVVVEICLHTKTEKHTDV